MTAHPMPDSSTDAPAVVWRELRPVPPHGLARPPHVQPRPLLYRPYLREVWQMSGRSRRTPGDARTYVARVCREWRIPHRIADDLVLIVSELTTNAITHAPGECVCVALLLTARDVWAVVIDHGPAKPIERRQADDDEHGRGLLLVEALADRWGQNRDGTSTAVWARIALPEQVAS